MLCPDMFVIVACTTSSLELRNVVEQVLVLDVIRFSQDKVQFLFQGGRWAQSKTFCSLI